jgi:CheY-like chemotaxis protein
MAEPPATDAGREDGATVLVVDDAPATRYIVASWLRRDGHRVLEAATGREALDLVHRQGVDVVVLDVGLPDISGFDVCAQIKGDPRLRLPVVHLSATSVEGRDRARGLDLGADAYLTDPVEPAELVATVNSVLRYYRARARAEELARQQAALTRAIIAMNGAGDLDALAGAIALGAAEMAAAPATAIVVAPGPHVRRVRVAGPGAAPAVASAPPQLLARLDALAALTGGEREPHRVPEAGDGWALVSRSRPGHPPVGIVVERAAPPPAAVVDALVQLGGAAALAVDAQRLHAEEHNLALTLQRSFLPDGFGELPGLRAAVRYLPAVEHAEIGGDFYEIVRLDGDRLLVAIGDVAGHSIHAATIMLELRHALRAHALAGDGPAEVLRRLERILRHFHPREYATMCVLLIDPGAGLVLVANAGHPPPLLVTADSADYAPVTGPMLGAGLPHPEQTVLALDPLHTVVLVTDGLIEDRLTDIDEAMRRLREWPTLRSDPEDLCDDLLANFGRNRSDDIALLVLRFDRAG